MESNLQVVGIDVSKATLAVCYPVQTRLQHAEVSNSKAGFEQLLRRCGPDCLYVMEATGSYYLALAYQGFFFQKDTVGEFVLEQKSYFRRYLNRFCC